MGHWDKVYERGNGYAVHMFPVPFPVPVPVYCVLCTDKKALYKPIASSPGPVFIPNPVQCE